MTSPHEYAGSSGQPSVEQAALIERIAGGDQQALSSLYDATNRLMYGLILRILKDTGAAEEVVLDVYTQVWRQAAKYSDRRGTPMAWLTTIARSRAIDRLRAGHADYLRHEPLDLTTQTATGDDIEEALAVREMQRTIRAALAEISHEQREVIELAYYSGLSHSEIAAKLIQPLGTVKTRIRLGMMRLRELLKDAGTVEQ